MIKLIVALALTSLSASAFAKDSSSNLATARKFFADLKASGPKAVLPLLASSLAQYEAAYEPGDGTCAIKYRKTNLTSEAAKVKTLENLRAALRSGGFDQKDGLAQEFDAKKREFGLTTSGDCEHTNSVRFDAGMKQIVSIFEDASPNDLSEYKGKALKEFNVSNP